MNTNHFCTIDELGRVLLPAKLCEQLGWKRDSKVNAQINQTDKSINLHAADDGRMTIDELGRITLGEGILSELGWEPGKISISTTGSALVIEQAST